MTKAGGIQGGEAEETLEQIVLVVDIIKFHSAECELQSLLDLCQTELILH